MPGPSDLIHFLSDKGERNPGCTATTRWCGTVTGLVQQDGFRGPMPNSNFTFRTSPGNESFGNIVV